MSFVTRAVQINWSWDGVVANLTGYEVAISLATAHPDNSTIIFGRSGRTATSHVFEAVTVEIGVQYKAWVRAVYGEKTSAWVAAGTTFTPDETWASGITTSLISEVGFSHMEGGEGAFSVGTATNVTVSSDTVTLTENQNTGVWESQEFGLGTVGDLSTSDIRWQIERDDYFHDYVLPTTNDGLHDNSTWTYDNIDTDVFFQQGKHTILLDVMETTNANGIYVELENANRTLTSAITDYPTTQTVYTLDNSLGLGDGRGQYCFSFEGNNFVIGDKRYILGGWNDSNSGYNSIVVCDLYGKKIEALTFSAIAIHGFVAGVWNGKIYIFGGYDTANKNTFQVFDPVAKTLSTITTDTGTIPSARRNAQGGIVGDYFYVFGGYDSAANATAYRRNMATGVWTTLTNMPNATYAAAAVVNNNKAYFFGGHTTATTNILQIFNLSTLTWETTQTLLKFGNRESSSYSLTGRNSVIFYGGNNGSTSYSNILEYFFVDGTLVDYGTPSGLPARYTSTVFIKDDYLYVLNGWNGSYQQSIYKYGPLYHRRSVKAYVDVPVGEKYNISVYRTGQKSTDISSPKIQLKATWAGASGGEYTLSSMYIKKKDGTLLLNCPGYTELNANGTKTNLFQNGTLLSNKNPTPVYTGSIVPYFNGTNAINLDGLSSYLADSNPATVVFFAKFYIDGVTNTGGTIWSYGQSETVVHRRYFAKYDTANSINTVTVNFIDGNGWQQAMTATGKLVAGWNTIRVVLYAGSSGSNTVYVNSDTAAAMLSTTVRASGYEYARLGGDRTGGFEAFKGWIREAVLDTSNATYLNTTVPAVPYANSGNIAQFEMYFGSSTTSNISIMYRNSTTLKSVTTTSSIPPVAAYGTSYDTATTTSYNYSTTATYETNSIVIPYTDIDSVYFIGTISNASYITLQYRTTLDNVTWTSYASFTSATNTLAFPTFTTYKWGFWNLHEDALQAYFENNYAIETNLYNGTSWLGWNAATTKTPITGLNSLSLANIKNCKFKFRVTFTRARFGGAVKLIYVASKIGQVRAFASEAGATNDSLWRSSNDYTKMDGGVIEASSRIIIGDNNIVLDGKSSDGVTNAIYVSEDGGPGGGTGIGGIPRDYVKLHSGNIEFFIAAEGMHRKYKALNKCVMGICNAGSWVTISDENGPVFWKQKPKVFVSYNQTLIYDATNSMQSQTIKQYVQDIQPVAEGSMQYKFLPILQLSLGAGSNGISIGTNTLSGHYTAGQSAFYTYSSEIPVNGTTKSIQVSVSVTGTSVVADSIQMTYDSGVYCTGVQYGRYGHRLYPLNQYTMTPTITYDTSSTGCSARNIAYCIEYQTSASSSIWNVAPALNFTATNNITKFRIRICSLWVDLTAWCLSSIQSGVVSYAYVVSSTAGIRIDYYSGDFTAGDITTPGNMTYMAIGE